MSLKLSEVETYKKILNAKELLKKLKNEPQVETQ
jgi:hypothetical protein